MKPVFRRRRTEYFWAMTLQWSPAPGAIRNSITFGTFAPERSRRHRELFEEALAHCRQLSGVPEEDHTAVVLFWHLTPNRMRP